MFMFPINNQTMPLKVQVMYALNKEGTFRKFIAEKNANICEVVPLKV